MRFGISSKYLAWETYKFEQAKGTLGIPDSWQVHFSCHFSPPVTFRDTYDHPSHSYVIPF